MQKDRDLSFDVFRGLAIIAVVAIHANNVGLSLRHLLPNQWNYLFLVICRQLFNFPVPVFFFVSGYWLSQKSISSLKEYKTFLTRRLLRIFIPYLLWSFIWLGYDMIVRTHNVNPAKITFALLTGGAANGYYFIIVIAQLYIITPFLQYINRRPYGLTLVFVLNMLGLLALYLSRVYGIVGHIPAALPFYSWIIFYEIGLLAGNRDSRMSVPRNMRFLILPAILVSLMLSEMEAMILLFRYDNLAFAVFKLKYSSLLYAVCIIIGFLVIRERIRCRPGFLVTLGNYSFGIYLIHCPVLDGVAGIFQKTGTIYLFQPLYQPVVVLITISICFVLIGIARRFLPQSFCHNILGF